MTTRVGGRSRTGTLARSIRKFAGASEGPFLPRGSGIGPGQEAEFLNCLVVASSGAPKDALPGLPPSQRRCPASPLPCPELRRGPLPEPTTPCGMLAWRVRHPLGVEDYVYWGVEELCLHNQKNSVAVGRTVVQRQRNAADLWVKEYRKIWRFSNFKRTHDNSPFLGEIVITFFLNCNEYFGEKGGK